MIAMLRSNTRLGLPCAAALAFLVWGTAAWSQSVRSEPSQDQKVQWIWTAETAKNLETPGTGYFRTAFRVIDPEQGQLQIAAQDQCDVYLNGMRLGGTQPGDRTIRLDLTGLLTSGVNVLAVRVDHAAGTRGGLAAAIFVKESTESNWRMLPSGPTWKATQQLWSGWNSSQFDDSAWTPGWVLAAASAAAESATSATQSTRNQEMAKEAPAEADDRGESQEKEPVSYTIVPEFEVETLVDESIGSLIAMEFDEWGRLICSLEGGGLVRVDVLVPPEDPKRIVPICDQVRNCQGILPLNGKLFVTGEGPDGLGLYRLTDSDRNGSFEQVESLLEFEGSTGEHGPHGLALGTDGYLYIAIGNASGVRGLNPSTGPYGKPYEGNIVPRVEDPGGHAVGVKAPGGTIARVRLDGSGAEVFAGGIRNAYDLAFSADGDVFVHDSDMETDVGTTWFRPTMVFRVLAGAEIGWRSGWGTFSTSYPDCVPAIVDTGRGSPTGMVMYQHVAFPRRYHNSVFLGDWSEGRILNVAMVEEGGTFKTRTEVFLKNRPLNVTDLSVGPDGALYFCTGGRGTGGGVFRIYWQGEVPAEVINPSNQTLKLVSFPQPQSAWARQVLAKTRTQLKEQWDTILNAAAVDRNLSPQQRVRALELLTLYGPVPDASLIQAASTDESPLVRARAALIMGSHPKEMVEPMLVRLLQDSDTNVRRVACESLARIGAEIDWTLIAHCLASAHRAESFAARRLLEQLPVETWRDEAIRSDNIRTVIQASLALTIAHPGTETGYHVLARSSELLDGFISDADFFDLLRAMQLALCEGAIDPEKIPAFVDKIRAEFPTRNERINGELARLLAYLQAQGDGSEYARYFAESNDSLRSKVYVALMLQTMGDRLSPTDRLATLRCLEQGLCIQGAGGGYYAYLNGAAEQLARRITKDEIDTVLADGAAWPHAVIATFFLLPHPLTPELVDQLIEVDRSPDRRTDTATRKMHAGILALLGGSAEPQAGEYLKHVWEQQPLRRSDVALVMAQRPEADFWKFLVASFPYLDEQEAGDVLMSLCSIERRPEEATAYRELIQLAQRLKDAGATAALSLLEHWSGQRLPEGDADWKTAIDSWRDWYQKEFPNQPPIDQPSEKRASANWTVNELAAAVGSLAGSGDANRGMALFHSAQCAKCHRFGTDGDSAGPELTSLASRFTRNEMIDAILNPSRVVSDQYRGKKIITTRGQTISGLLTLGPDQSWVIVNSSGERVTIPADEVESIEDMQTSSMPDGLLDQLTAKDVADLLHFLESASGDRLAAETENKPAATR